MYNIALQMLFGDRSKYFMLISALAFATVLTTQQCAVFLGLMRWTTATLMNTQVPIWVMDPNVSQANEVKALRDTDLNRVRSVTGVKWALPFFFSLQQARLPDGSFKMVQFMGVDPTSLIGVPADLIEGRLEDLRQANAVIIDSVGLRKLREERGGTIGVGTIFEINDRQLKIVGICKAFPSFFGYPQIFTTYDRALQTVPQTRQNLSFILVMPKEGIPISKVVDNIKTETHLKALTEQNFFWSTIWWFVRNTSIPTSFGATVLLGFIVGVAVAGQTFYTFILENLGSLGALKAMGASNSLLCRMLLLQAFCSGLIGYGIGLGITGAFGFIALRAAQFPFYMSYHVPLMILVMILIICAVSAFVGIRKVSKLEAAEVFRA